MATPTVPSDWTAMTSKKIGSEFRNTNEPGGSRLLLQIDDLPTDITDPAGGALANPLTFDFLDIGLPSLAASAYSTQLLAQRKWATQGVSRIIAGDSITGTIECSGFTYALMMSLIGAKGTARIEIPNQGWFSQWRVAILSVDGPALQDGDRMTGSLVLTVTNTAPNDKDEMAPVFGTYTPSNDAPAGETISPEAPPAGGGGT